MKPTTPHPAAYVFVLAGAIVLALWGLGAVLADDTPIGSNLFSHKTIIVSLCFDKL